MQIKTTLRPRESLPSTAPTLIQQWIREVKQAADWRRISIRLSSLLLECRYYCPLTKSAIGGSSSKKHSVALNGSARGWTTVLF